MKIHLVNNGSSHAVDALITVKMSRTVQSNLPKDFGKRVSGENHFLKGSLLTD